MTKNERDVVIVSAYRIRQERFGIATLCLGGGMGLATVLELEG